MKSRLFDGPTVYALCLWLAASLESACTMRWVWRRSHTTPAGHPPVPHPQPSRVADNAAVHAYQSTSRDCTRPRSHPPRYTQIHRDTPPHTQTRLHTRSKHTSTPPPPPSTVLPVLMEPPALLRELCTRRAARCIPPDNSTTSRRPSRWTFWRLSRACMWGARMHQAGAAPTLEPRTQTSIAGAPCPPPASSSGPCGAGANSSRGRETRTAHNGPWAILVGRRRGGWRSAHASPITRSSRASLTRSLAPCEGAAAAARRRRSR